MDEKPYEDLLDDTVKPKTITNPRNWEQYWYGTWNRILVHGLSDNNPLIYIGIFFRRQGRKKEEKKFGSRFCSLT
jgi:hypothetical protein